MLSLSSAKTDWLRGFDGEYVKFEDNQVEGYKLFYKDSK